VRAKVKITYNTEKLMRALPKMIEDYIGSAGSTSAEESRKSIDEVRHGKQLSQRTIKLRLEGQHPSGKTIRTTDTTPLKWSKYLYNNIKGTKKGLEIPKYGYYHHIGEAWGFIKRPFITFKVGNKTRENFRNQLSKNFRK